MVMRWERRSESLRRGEREKTVQGLLLYWTSEGASGEWGVGVRDNGQRQRKETGWEEMEMGTQAFVRAGTPGTHHSAWYKVMPATIPLPLIP